MLGTDLVEWPESGGSKFRCPPLERNVPEIVDTCTRTYSSGRPGSCAKLSVGLPGETILGTQRARLRATLVGVFDGVVTFRFPSSCLR